VSAAAPDRFAARLRQEGTRRYHDRHPFHQRMHRGELGRAELRHWVRNRYYYQSRIPIKDALILAKSEDAAFRRRWIRRILEQDGAGEGEGGLDLWLRLAAAVGLDPAEVTAYRGVVPGVRFACDAYLESVRGWSLLEAVAASLTECFAPDLMAARIEAWERHYGWVDRDDIAYFRRRVSAARRDGEEGLALVLEQATTGELQDRCVAALVVKTEILWHLLDSIEATCREAS
jgi:pyrroloquinoline-quinone synthase